MRQGLLKKSNFQQSLFLWMRKNSLERTFCRDNIRYIFYLFSFTENAIFILYGDGRMLCPSHI